MRKEYKSTTKDIVFSALKALVNESKAVTSLDASSFAVGLAVKHGINPNTVCRARRLYIEKQLAFDLKQREDQAFTNIVNKLN